MASPKDTPHWAPLPSILNDAQIEEAGIIQPFLRHEKRKGIISYGCSHFGYDIRLGSKFKIFTNVNATMVDPKNVDPTAFYDKISEEPITIPPHSYVLAESLEYFTMPKDVIGVCVGKSTYARCALIVNVTPLEPGWNGILTIEISNSSPCPVRVYPYEGICQILFFRGTQPDVTYDQKGGKYDNQDGLTLPKCD